MDSIAHIVAEIQQGSVESAERLYREFQPLVLRVIRRHLSRDMRRVSDSLDFSQIVWKTLFEHASRMPHFEDPQVVAAYIARVATNKVRGEMRAQLSLKRDVRRTPDALSSKLWSIQSRDPTPSQSVMAKERLDTLCAGLDSMQRQMIEQRIQGLNIDEIAHNLGISERTVRRVLKRISPSPD